MIINDNSLLVNDMRPLNILPNHNQKSGKRVFQHYVFFFVHITVKGFVIIFIERNILIVHVHILVLI